MAGGAWVAGSGGCVEETIGQDLTPAMETEMVENLARLQGILHAPRARCGPFRLVHEILCHEWLFIHRELEDRGTRL